MTEQQRNAFLYAKGKVFIKLAALFLCCIAVMIVMAAMQETDGLILFPAMVSLAPAGFAIYYAVLFKRGKVTGTVCHVVEKRRDLMGGLLSGLSFHRNRYSFEYENGKGGKTVFQISRGGWFSPLAAGQRCLVLHRSYQELSAANFIECIAIKDEMLN